MDITPEALPARTLYKLHYLIHEIYLTNLLSFLELLNCGSHDCHPLLSLNSTICHLLNLTSTNLILSPFLFKLPSFSQFFLCRGFVIGPTAKNNSSSSRKMSKQIKTTSYNLFTTKIIRGNKWKYSICSVSYKLRLYSQCRRKNSEALGQKRKMRPPASEVSRRFSGSIN